LILSMATWFSASAVIPQLREAWNLSTGSGAWLTIAVQLGFVAGALVSSMGNVADVFDARSVIIGGAVGAAFANVLLVFVHSLALGLPLRFTTGFFLAGVYPPALKLMATWFRRGRGLALGVLVGALTIGSASPHLVNGLGGLEWKTVVIVTSVLTLLGAICVTAVKEGPYPFPRAKLDPRQARMALSNRGVRLASLGYFGHMWELYAMWSWFLVFFGTSLHATGSDEAVAPYGAFAVIAIGAAGCVIGGILGDRWGRARTTMAMMATSAVCAITIGFFVEGPTVVVLAIAAIWGFSVVGDSAQFSTIVTELADQAYVGTALTLQLALGFTLTVVTIWLIPVLADHLGWRWAFAFLAPGPILGTIAMARLKGSPEGRAIAGGIG
jgi:MFS family permease